jgi:hypothetical protein
MTQEIWKEVPGYPDYEVSDQGNIRSLKFGEINMLSPVKIGKYLAVNLGNKHAVRKHWTVYIHHLVSIVFLGHWPKKGSTVLNHIDGNRYNNRPENLELLPLRKSIQKSKQNKGGDASTFGVHKLQRVQKRTGNLQVKWKAATSVGSKFYYLGTYNTKEEAQKAYNDFIESLNEQPQINKTPTIL